MPKIQSTMLIPVLGVIMFGGGVLAGYAGLAAAETSDTAATPPASVLKNFSRGTGGQHRGANGTQEELLTGDVAAKVTALAQAAEPGATVDRVETDAEGADYEAHMTRSDGTHITLKLDKNYTVTATEDGPHRP